MQVRQDHFDVGVIVGRFQVPELHAAHRDLIEHVMREHDKVVVFLGLSPLFVTRENPLDFEARKQMLLAAYPDLNVLYIKDVSDDGYWSQQLDERVRDLVTPSQSVVLYGGRDSFIAHYSGKLPTRVLEQDVWISGNEIRKGISRRSVKASPNFRAGVVWAAYSQFPRVNATVDVAIVTQDHQRVWLGRKAHETRFRFIGGFTDPKDDSFEQTAKREAQEETGLEISEPAYLGTFWIDDWRYRSEVDKIITTFYWAYALFGVPKPNDDIVELKCFDIAKLTIADVVPSHHVLLQRFELSTQDTDIR